MARCAVRCPALILFREAGLDICVHLRLDPVELVEYLFGVQVCIASEFLPSLSSRLSVRALQEGFAVVVEVSKFFREPLLCPSDLPCCDDCCALTRGLGLPVGVCIWIVRCIGRSPVRVRIQNVRCIGRSPVRVRIRILWILHVHQPSNSRINSFGICFGVDVACVAESPMKWQDTLLKVNQLVSLFLGDAEVRSEGHRR
ncbi:unnamed protein product [Sphagnum tenellum]